MLKKSVLLKIEKYKKITKEALSKIDIKKGLSEKEKKTALDFIQMSKNYYSDALHFEKKKD